MSSWYVQYIYIKYTFNIKKLDFCPILYWFINRWCVCLDYHLKYIPMLFKAKTTLLFFLSKLGLNGVDWEKQSHTNVLFQSY